MQTPDRVASGQEAQQKPLERDFWPKKALLLALCVQEELLIEDCLRLMRMSDVRSVPVVRGLTPAGILSFSDVLRAVSS
jgi:hypothetical protein